MLFSPRLQSHIMQCPWSTGPRNVDIKVINWIHHQQIWILPLFAHDFLCRSSLGMRTFLFHNSQTHMSREGAAQFGWDPSVCVLLTDPSHIIIAMATRVVALATASSQSALQLDMRAAAAGVTIQESRQVSLTFTKVNPPLLRLSSSPPLSLACIYSSLPLKVNNTPRYCTRAPKTLLTQVLLHFISISPPYPALPGAHHPGHCDKQILQVLWQQIIAAIRQTQLSREPGKLIRLNGTLRSQA